MNPRPDSRNARIVAYVAEEPCSTAADVAADLGISAVDASSTMRKLYERGVLERRASSVRPRRADGSKFSGPPVYVYTVRA